MTPHLAWLYAAALCFLTGALFTARELLYRRLLGGRIAALLVGGAVLTGAAIAERWARVGHGPFLTMYEILISSLFSLGLVYGLAYWRHREVRAGAPAALGVIVVLWLWTANVDPGFQPLPPTYATPWLWAHVVTGKLFLGTCLVAASLGLVLLLPARPRDALLTLRGLGVARLETLAWRWLALAFVCHSAMLVTGAVWAQDAWGRYWDWDPLETWAFGTWLTMAAGLHARVSLRIGPRTGSAILLGAFVLAFLTFFGVPFISLAPHQGAV